MSKRRRWIPIVVGVVILLLFIAIGGIFFSVSWMRQNLQVDAASESDADSAFEEVRQRFATKPPLVTFENGLPRTDLTALENQPRVALNNMHVLAWDPRARRLVRFSIPFWLLRLKETPIQFGAYASGADELGIRLRASDIERYGPGIVVDATLPRRGRALIWVD